METKVTISRDASDRLTVEVHSAEASEYGGLVKGIVNRFNLIKAGKKTVGLDEMFQDYKLNEYIVGLEWDNWSGFIVVAKTKESETLVTEISQYLIEEYENKT